MDRAQETAPSRLVLAACSLAVLGLTGPAVAGGLEVLGEDKLLASDGQVEDRFGSAVALDGDTAVIGAYLDDDKGDGAGSAYVFVRSGGVWVEQAKLLASDGAALDKLGLAVAVHGDTAVVGAPWESIQIGAAYVYVRNNGVWTEEAKLSPTDGGSLDWFATAVAVNDQTIVVGAPGHDVGGGVGAAYVFVRNPITLTWEQEQKVFLTDPGDLGDGGFGQAVSLQGDSLIIGDPFDFPGPGLGSAGAAYVFTRAVNVWSLEQKVTANPVKCCENFGISVSLDGSTALVGAVGDADLGFTAGSAYAFRREVGGWVEQAELNPASLAYGDRFGETVSLSGDVAMIGARSNGPSGAAFFFGRSGSTWSEEARVDPGGYTPFYGLGVAIDNGVALVAAREDNENGFRAGSVFTYGVSAAPTGPVSYCTAGTSASGCQASLAATGTPSATALSGFDLTTTAVEGSKDGLYFFGSNGRQANPWGNGSSFQCVTPPVRRAGIQLGSGTPGSCDGAFAQDLNALWCPTCPNPGKNPGAGAVVQAQLWYRDPLNTSNQTTSLSNAVEFTVEL